MMAFDYKEHYQKNREEIIKRNSRYQKEHREQVSLNKREWSRRRRLEAVAALGGRCSSPSCRWVNEDETWGCNNPNVLQIDHVKSNGYEELKKGSPNYIGNDGIIRRILNGEKDDYQLLCPTCNWLKRHTADETKRLRKY